MAYLDADDRTVAVVFASSIEERLLARLRRSLHGDEEEFEKHFGLNSPSSSFIAVARISYLTRIITKETFEDLKRVAKIRNHFAHRIDARTFDEQPVRDWSAAIKTVETLVVPSDERPIADGESVSPDAMVAGYRLGTNDPSEVFKSPKLRYAYFCIAKAEHLNMAGMISGTTGYPMPV